MSTTAAESLEELAPDARPRRHGRWSRRCPRCLSTALTNAPKGTLACAACEAVFPPPGRADELATWETDPRLAEAWDGYSARGGLVATWGRSTDRADGGPPPEGDVAEEMPPRVRANAVFGEADELLDEERRQYLELTSGLVEAIDQVKPLAIQLARAATRRPAKKAPRPRPAPSSERFRPRRTAEEYSLTWRGIPAPDAELVVDEMRHHFRDVPTRAPPAPAADPYEPGEDWYHPRLVAAAAPALLGCVQALALLAVNALRARGVEYEGSTEQVRARTQRSEPFGGYRHALAAAYGLTDPGECSALPHGAIATHALPQGMVLGKIACHPSRSYSARAREPDTGADDVWAAIRDARVGTRTYSEGGKVRHAPGRPLTELELELVRLVDAGQLHPCALVSGQGRRSRVTRLAIEPLHPREALAALRVAGFEGVPTEHEAKLLLVRARHAIKRVLEDRGLIPGFAEVHKLPDAPPAATAGDRRRRKKEAA